MPTYDYFCPQCNKTHSKFQPISSKPYLKCPGCGKKLNRSITGGTGIIFKGTGFYTTDYKKKETAGSGKSPSSETGEKNSGNNNAEKNTDKKESSADKPKTAEK